MNIFLRRVVMCWLFLQLGAIIFRPHHATRKAHPRSLRAPRRLTPPPPSAPTRIPKIVHYVHVHTKNETEFPYLSYLSIVSTHVVLRPQRVYLHLATPAGEPWGQWWDAILPLVTLRYVDEPTNIGEKPILQPAHVSDVIRMQVMLEVGGIYLDFDTIAYRPIDDLLVNNSAVMGEQRDNGLCNAVIMAEPRAPFLQAWWARYERAFKPDGWGDASVELPWQMWRGGASNITVLPETAFFWPSWREVHLIWTGEPEPQADLRILHYWSSASKGYSWRVNPEWIRSSNCLASKLMKPLLPYLNGSQQIQLRSPGRP